MSRESISKSKLKKVPKDMSRGETMLQRQTTQTSTTSPTAPRLPDLPRIETLSSGEDSKSEVGSIFSGFSAALSPASQQSDIPAVPPLPDLSPISTASSPLHTSHSHGATQDSGDSLTNRTRYSYGGGVSSVRAGKRMRRRREPTSFNVLVVGSKNSGKTSFVNFLRSTFEKSSFSTPPHGCTPGDLSPSAANVGFEPHYIEGKIDGEFMGITIWDSEAFEKNLVDIQIDTVAHFLEDKFENTFGEEMKVIRQPHSRDTHIHCAFLLLDPARLDENIKAASVDAKRMGKPGATPPINVLDEDLDVRALRAIAARTTVVPVISKADTITTTHMAKLKKDVANSLKFIGLDPLEQLMDDTEEGDEEEEEAAESQEAEDAPIIPMSIMSPDEDTLHPSFINPVGRYFPWGFADPYNEKHCDFLKVKEVVFEDWLSDLRIISRDVWYEKWRTQKLKVSRRSKTNF
ncbi:hypothetical protein KEM56_004827 [Ascosphaera pollenicola]|nr:hypothetical protein KEM56_004827 [Ascosphaera pollenicola]